MQINGRDVKDIVGSAHVAGKYNFTEQDYLNEGADKLLELGMRVAKLWFTPKPYRDYPFNSEWPKIESLVQLAETQYFQKVFAKPFTTFILEAFPPGSNEHYIRSGLTKDDVEREYNAFYDITKYFLTKYKGTGKTFILQNWETDWMLTDPQFTREITPVAVQGMADWLNARQDGVSAARKDVGMDGVKVAHAMEVNLIARAMEGKTSATNDVVPKTHCDLYSYSAYDTSIFKPEIFRDALDYLADKAPASELYGSKNVMVAEFGAPENEFDQYSIVKNTVEVALDWGAYYVVYWELYCNEIARKYEGRPANSDQRGFWLIRPDGTKAPAWNYFEELFSR